LQYQHIPVGENLLWEPYFPMVMQIEQQLAKIDDLAFVDRAHQVVMRMQFLLSSRNTPFARLEIETSEDWSALRAEANKPDRSEAFAWLEELLSQL
jgi:hypothetical protein